jgi:hypothetical protein
MGIATPFCASDTWGVSDHGANVELLGKPDEDWRRTLIDTGIWCNIGERLWVALEHIKNATFPHQLQRWLDRCESRRNDRDLHKALV